MFTIWVKESLVPWFDAQCMQRGLSTQVGAYLFGRVAVTVTAGKALTDIEQRSAELAYRLACVQELGESE